MARGLKQDISFETKIINKENVMINEQYIGKLKGLKLDLDLKIGALDTDVKSLKKAARQNVAPEILKRVNEIITNPILELRNDFKIYWQGDPIARLVPGRDYLSPELSLIIDEMIEYEDQKKLFEFLNKWLNKKIYDDLESLFKLKFIKESNSQVRALAFHLYENNGVVKRDIVKKIVDQIDQNQRKVLRDLGVKFGRYHIFMFKLFKPVAVSLRILLWKNFSQKLLKFEPPTFGLNFLEDQHKTNQKLMLLCGFEKFDNFYVRIDILERLFIHIIKLGDKNNKDIKLSPEMLNLLGCNKSNFVKLIKLMNYKTTEKNNEIYFKYFPKKLLNRNKDKAEKDNAFSVLSQLIIK